MHPDATGVDVDKVPQLDEVLRKKLLGYLRFVSDRLGILSPTMRTEKPDLRKSDDGEYYTFNFCGLNIQTLQLTSELLENLYPFGNLNFSVEGKYVAKVDFTPFGYKESHEELVPESLAALYIAITDYFQRLKTNNENNKLKAPDFLFGRTNKNMAKFAGGFGFTIVEPSSKEEDLYLVYGKPEDILNSLAEGNWDERLAKLASRIQKKNEIPDDLNRVVLPRTSPARK